MKKWEAHLNNHQLLQAGKLVWKLYSGTDIQRPSSHLCSIGFWWGIYGIRSKTMHRVRNRNSQVYTAVQMAAYVSVMKYQCKYKSRTTISLKY